MRRRTIREINEKRASRIRRRAAQEEISLNRVVVKLLWTGAGLGQPTQIANTAGSSLDHLIETWTAQQVDNMQSALDDFSGGLSYAAIFCSS